MKNDMNSKKLNTAVLKELTKKLFVLDNSINDVYVYTKNEKGENVFLFSGNLDINEIDFWLEKTPDFCRFKTENNIYFSKFGIEYRLDYSIHSSPK